MKKITLISAGIFTLGMASCFSVDLTSGVFACDPTQSGECPEGQKCSPNQKICVAVSGELPDLATDSGSQVTVAEGCPLLGAAAGMGYEVTAAGKPRVFACPGKFKNQAGQTADTQCRAPYVLCTTGSNVDLAACNKVGQATAGYFIANVEANRKFNGLVLACGAPSGSGTTPLWAGCGRAATAIACQGFATAQDCALATGGFQCSGIKLGDLSNTDSASGVLCCQP